jgi:hypothetical protein
MVQCVDDAELVRKPMHSVHLLNVAGGGEVLLMQQVPLFAAVVQCVP